MCVSSYYYHYITINTHRLFRVRLFDGTVNSFWECIGTDSFESGMHCLHVFMNDMIPSSSIFGDFISHVITLEPPFAPLSESHQYSMGKSLLNMTPCNWIDRSAESITHKVDLISIRCNFVIVSFWMIWKIALGFVVIDHLA